MNTQIHREFTAMPDRIKRLPLDPRGYPIPFFVGKGAGGELDFRVMDIFKWRRAIREKLCWVCGGTLGVNMVFVAGCMCGVNCTSTEPPCHYECALWSAVNCPFLANPDMVRREDAVVNNEQLRENAPGFAITRNPGVAMLWVTKEYEVFPDGRGGRLIQMGKPRRVEWYREGRQATLAEVMESVSNGLPALESLARQEKGGLEALQQALARFQQYLPKE